MGLLARHDTRRRGRAAGPSAGARVAADQAVGDWVRAEAAFCLVHVIGIRYYGRPCANCSARLEAFTRIKGG
jgi:hypothetical protein